MSLYDIAYVTWPVLLALLVAVPGVLLFANRRAWKNGYDEGYLEGCKDIEDLWESEARAGRSDSWWDPPPIDVAERLKPYVSRVDPPNANYETARPTGYTCAHCGGIQLGYTAVGESKLCHPDRGRVDGGLPLDCYRLVTVHDHAMPCVNCQTKNAAVDAGNY